MNPKDRVVDEICRRVHHHDTLSSAEVDITSESGRTIAFDLVDLNKYTLRDELIDEFEATVDDHTVELVIEEFTSQRVTVVPVDTTAHAELVSKFVYERDNAVRQYLEDYDSLTLAHVEALEQWGAVGRLHELDAKHFHDAFHEYHRVDDADALDLAA